jgi:hypothetical protein
LLKRKHLKLKKRIRWCKIRVYPDIITARNETLNANGKERTRSMVDIAIARLHIPVQNFMSIMQNELQQHTAINHQYDMDILQKRRLRDIMYAFYNFKHQ